MPRRRVDPVRQEVFHHLYSAWCEEAGVRLQRSAISPNIRERADFSVAVFDRRGALVAQAAHIPVHLGAMPDAVAAVRPAGVDAHTGVEDAAGRKDPARVRAFVEAALAAARREGLAA